MSRAALALAVALAGCTPLRVDIVEEPAGGFVASARGTDRETCDEAGRRVLEEARYFCDVRGREATAGNPVSRKDGAGCRVTLLFTCGGAMQ